ncbi:MAG: formylglycine-generating enzyme family protein [Hyphomicrobium sp.]|uniref:formylglycine-generating enzyme family protein n=1 Tax=Hyphomicrobium sp. TaxID=82 RepID=UPI0039E6ECD6
MNDNVSMAAAWSRLGLLFMALIAMSATPHRASFAADASSAAKTINDCPTEHCPEMVVIPASPQGFEIGSPDDEPERLPSEKLHPVSIGSFAIGKYEVRTAEYMACVDAKACSPPEWLEPGSEHNIYTGGGVTYKSMTQYIKGDNQPIVGVSWDDANTYAEWLSKKTGHHYRLPSEAEWEYAARAGSKTPFWWGNEPKENGETMACCRGCGSDRDGVGAYPVDSFKPNGFGLFNVHGNVWEWVEDYYCDDYETGPKDGSARQSKSCGKPGAIEGLRIFRGGSCFYEPRQMRAAMRLRNWPFFRNQTLGFRIARDLSP